MLTGFKAGIGLVIVLDQVPKLLGIHIAKQGFFPDLVSLVAAPARNLADHAGGRRRDAVALLVGMERLRPHSPAPLVVGGGRHRRVVVLRPAARRASRPSGIIPQGLPSLTLPDLALVWAAAARARSASP